MVNVQIRRPTYVLGCPIGGAERNIPASNPDLKTRNSLLFVVCSVVGNAWVRALVVKSHLVCTV